MLRTAIVTAAVGLTIMALTARPSAGFGGYCTEPQPPWCVDQSSTFKDESSFSRCRSDVESYTRRVDNYVDCLSEEQRSAIQKSNKVVSRFNCMARGGSSCFF